MSHFTSFNPYTGKILEEYSSPSQEDIEIALTSADSAFDSWKETTFENRAVTMKKAAEILRDQKEKYARIISEEMGKVISESTSEVEKCAWVCDYYASEAEEFLADILVELPEGGKAKIKHQPIGAVLAIMPWNFPFWQVFRFAAPTLMAGNVGILKHASNVPRCALAIEEVFNDAGFPEGVFQSLLIDSDAVSQLIADPRIKAVTLTGSEKAGAAVASQAGKHIKKSLLELGGSDPFIVLKDANLEEAAKTAVKARMINFGQSCIAAKRFIVEEAVYDQFLEKFEKHLASLKKGEPMDEDADYACMARADLAKDLYEQVKKSVDKGAKIRVGGKKPEKDSPHFEPTILTDIPKDAPAYSEELFGPVALMFKVKDAEEAIDLANDSEFGLGGSLWSGDVKKAEKIAERIETGAVFINSMTASNPHLPFGGVKKSGYGRELSRNGILEFVNVKTVYLG